jgi:thiamine biosynthesis lipoprotein
MTDSREDAPDYAARKMTNHTELDLGEDWARIPANTAIDAGGIGKGYLADRLAERLREKTENYCLSLGGDMAIGGVDENGSWTIDIQSAQDRSADIAVFSGQRPSYGIATSGILREKNNTAQVHLIDPRTGAPAPASKNICTVAAPNAVTADVMASCILIDGRNLAESLIEKELIDAVLLQEIEHKPIVIGKGFTFQENFPSTS